MADQPIDLIFLITPKPGKHDDFITLFNACAAHAKEHEPGTTRYYLHRGFTDKGHTNNNQLVVRETYANAEALKVHSQAAPVKAILKAIMGGTIVETSQLIHLSPDGRGYDRGVSKLKL
ncbi:hypothetical protein F5X68DRAFT_207222 [Plectosphaerella plurivora]|uniref:ABM domain-containing protein n=1 Tax=Plectosphaerella plurivora TaxID=936078 RepID=A0A9P8VDD7_9PEZI|nr:hypothetical protein F5X68DRAFT_207222 [Plectosphaerella plurivora]